MGERGWIRQVYGYLVCLIALVTFLLAARAVVEAAIDLSDPLSAQARFGPPVASSFEAYVAGDGYDRPRPPAEAGQADTASVETLRRRWEALRQDRIRQVRFQATRTLTTQGLLIVIAVLLFVFHWRWLARMEERATDEGSGSPS